MEQQPHDGGRVVMTKGERMRDRCKWNVGLIAALVLIVAVPAMAQTQLPDVVEYYHADAPGSVRAVTDASGAVVRTSDYRPFGEGENPAAGVVPARFTGKERDRESGLDYFGARYYASRTGRFTSVDPVLDQQKALLDPQRWNRYAYALNNPLRNVDPDGREPVPTARQLDFELPKWGYAAFGLSTAIGAVAIAGPTAWRAAVGCFLSPSCQSSAIQVLEEAAGGSPRITALKNVDPAATTLAQKLGGRASVAIEGFGDREFDAISREFVAQTFGGASALLKPRNFLSDSRRAQIVATLQAAKATGRKAYFEFQNGVHDDVLGYIGRAADEIGVDFYVSR
jgi:RHS repeat-associated protein